MSKIFNKLYISGTGSGNTSYISTGTGFTIDIIHVGAGGIDIVALNGIGSGYALNDIVFVSGGDGNATMKITVIGGVGQVGDFEIVYGGTGYSAGSNVSTTNSNTITIGSSGGNALTVISSTCSSNLISINSMTYSQVIFKIKNYYSSLTYSTLNSNVNLFYEKSNNLLSIDGSGVVNLNGNIYFRDINFITQSYATNSQMTGNISGFVLQNGKKISSPWFKGNEFTTNGSFFWMEAGYSKAWNTYSLLGDVKKINSYITFSSGTSITYSLYYDNSYPGLTYSEILNVTILDSNQVYVYPEISKSILADRIDLNIFTSGMTSANVLILCRNINVFSFSRS